MSVSIRPRAAVVAGVALGLTALALPAAGDVAGADGRPFFRVSTSPANAEFYNRQWNLKAVRAKAGWPAEPVPASTSDEVLVAIVDTGIDYLHPDLGIRRNADGSPGTGGLVDLDKSTSLIEEVAAGTTCTGEPGIPYRGNRTRDPFDELAEATSRGRESVTDFHSHGTAVTGLIASKAHWLAGVTQHTTLFGVKVHGMGRTNCLSVYLEGIRYAAEQGADVIHLSIPLEFDAVDPRFAGAVDAINDALDDAHAHGAILVAAAGNAMPGMPPSNLDEGTTFRFCEGNHVVCVSATGPTSADLVEEPYWDQIASYSHYGSPIDVAGPGGTTAVPVTLTCSRVALFAGAPQAPCRAGGETWQSTGTSFGAAATSGLAALLVGLTQHATPDQIELLIEDSAVDLGTAGWDPSFGEGRIDVKRAVNLAAP
jgi:subtilisin family serine protease